MENICKQGMPHKWFLALKVIFPVGLGKGKISCFAHLGYITGLVMRTSGFLFIMHVRWCYTLAGELTPGERSEYF